VEGVRNTPILREGAAGGLIAVRPAVRERDSMSLRSLRAGTREARDAMRCCAAVSSSVPVRRLARAFVPRGPEAMEP
jgi:hypothetical protein